MAIRPTTKEKFSYSVGAVVTAMWSISIIVGLFTHDYEGVKYVTPIMAGVAGWLFGIEIVRKVKVSENGGGGHDGNDRRSDVDRLG